MELLAERLGQIFDHVTVKEKRDLSCVQVSDVVSILQQTAEYVVMEWSADPIADMVADAVLATLLQLDDDPSTARRHLSQPSKPESGPSDGGQTDVVDRDMVVMLLQDLFGDVRQQRLSKRSERGKEGEEG
eukprot:9481886-Pyramimonas_sp.AAC.1